MSDFNRGVIEEFRANHGAVGGGFAGAPMVLLTTTGAKSGQKRVNPLVGLLDGGTLYVVASKAGAPTSPDWYHNLLANPQVEVEFGDERFDGHGRPDHLGARAGPPLRRPGGGAARLRRLREGDDTGHPDRGAAPQGLSAGRPFSHAGASWSREAAMLGIHGVGRDKADYYLSDLARELPVAGPGRGRGRAAVGLGLAGSVAPDAFRRLLQGRHPGTGTGLGSGRVSVAAFDLTFSAPKSASVLFALGGPRRGGRRGGRRTAEAVAGSLAVPRTARHHGRSGERAPSAPCWRPAGRWPRSSRTGSAATAIRISTAMSWWPISSTAWTGGGVPATGGGSMHIASPRRRSTRRTCGPG